MGREKYSEDPVSPEKYTNCTSIMSLGIQKQNRQVTLSSEDIFKIKQIQERSDKFSLKVLADQGRK